LPDFNLYCTLRFGYPPPKVVYLAHCAWHDEAQATWPDVPQARRHEYDIAAVKAHLRMFL
jgi:NAD+ synthase (glutamine-hydrolysing)